MKAGQELDTKIAEKVMGWTKVEVPIYARYEDVENLPRPCFWETFSGISCIREIMGEWRPQDFFPSTNITHAWEVLEVIQLWGIRKQKILFQAALIEQFDWNDRDWWAYKPEEVAEKICLAALEVVTLLKRNKQKENAMNG